MKIKFLSIFLIITALVTHAEIIQKYTEEEMLLEIDIYQEAYLLTHETYFQGIKTSNPLTEETKPTYQNESWSDLNLSKSSPYEIEIHQYVSPAGQGYNIFYYKTELGKNYYKSIGFGPEAADRTYDWVELKSKL